MHTHAHTHEVNGSGANFLPTPTQSLYTRHMVHFRNKHIRLESVVLP